MILENQNKPMNAALIVLAVLQIVMLSSLYGGVAPHPPAATPLFGIAPFIGMAVGVAFAAIVLGTDDKGGKVLALIAAIAAAVSFGPQKYVDPAFPLIWPAVLSGQVAIVAIVLMVFKRPRN